MNTDCPNCGKWIEAATEAARERNAMKDKLVVCQGRNDRLAEALKKIEYGSRFQCKQPLGHNGICRIARQALDAYSEPHTKL